MQSLTATITYQMSLTTEELRLVLQSLGGRLKPEDQPAARELGDRLTRERATQVQQMIRWTERLLSQVSPATE